MGGGGPVGREEYAVLLEGRLLVGGSERVVAGLFVAGVLRRLSLRLVMNAEVAAAPAAALAMPTRASVLSGMVIRM